VEEILERLGFAVIGKLENQRLVYAQDARATAGDGGAVYVFLNRDGRVWKVGMTRQGFSRVDYTRVFDGRAMSRPHEQRKLESIRREVRDGATQWVLRTEQPELLETLLSCLLNPTESNRSHAPLERALRRLTGELQTGQPEERSTSAP
jgi:hypothetical protein